jgi:hypothetical protein
VDMLEDPLEDTRPNARYREGAIIDLPFERAVGTETDGPAVTGAAY